MVSQSVLQHPEGPKTMTQSLWSGTVPGLARAHGHLGVRPNLMGLVVRGKCLKLGEGWGWPNRREGGEANHRCSAQDPLQTEQCSLTGSVIHMTLMSCNQKPSLLLPLPEFSRDSGELWDSWGYGRANPMKSLEAEPSKGPPVSAASLHGAPLASPHENWLPLQG